MIGELRYAAYHFNREQAPHVAAQEWAVIFPDWERLEARYQREKKQAH